MPRAKAFTDLSFINALPRNEAEAINIKVVQGIVGCSLSSAQNNVRRLVKEGFILEGPAGYYGSATYYRAAGDNVGEIAMPQIKSSIGVYKPFDKVVRRLLEGKHPIPQTYRNIRWAILELFNAAMNDIPQNKEDELPAVNQKVRAHLIEYRKGVMAVVASIDSIINDPYLNNDLESAGAAMLAMSDGIDKQVLNDLVNEYRKAVL